MLLLAPEHVLNARLPTHGYSYQYRPSPGRESTHRLRGAKPLLAATETLLDLVDRRVEIQPLSTAGGVQLQLTDYPQQAVREIIVNALLHRSYETQGSVDIEHSPERLTITSPGGLVAGVAPENILTHPSTPRHRLLAEAISLCQLAERTGQGIDRAYREMLRAGKSPPSIADLGLLVRTDLIGGIGNDAFVRYIRDLPDDLSSDVDVLIALSLLRTSTSIDAHHLAPVIQRGPSDAQDVLARLADNRHGILEPTEAVDWLERGDLDAPAVVRAAMAHLHVVAIHPFRDGNGRVARITQSLVLAREGMVSFEFASIEEYLGERTQDYYEVLERTQAGSYKPERSGQEWVEFCVDAHIDQAQRRLDQIAAAGERWGALEKIVEDRGWPDRMVIALEQGLVGGTNRTRYIREADISPATASADLRRLVDASLIDRRGRGPSSRYVATDLLRREIG